MDLQVGPWAAAVSLTEAREGVAVVRGVVMVGDAYGSEVGAVEKQAVELQQGACDSYGRSN